MHVERAEFTAKFWLRPVESAAKTRFDDREAATASSVDRTPTRSRSRRRGMSTSVDDAVAVGVVIDERELHVRMKDGRTISVPLDWFPRLAAASVAERAVWRLIGVGRASTGRSSMKMSPSPISSEVAVRFCGGPANVVSSGDDESHSHDRASTSSTPGRPRWPSSRADTSTAAVSRRVSSPTGPRERPSSRRRRCTRPPAPSSGGPRACDYYWITEATTSSLPLLRRELTRPPPPLRPATSATP